MIGACWFSPWYPLTPTDRVFAAPHRDSGPCDRRSTEEAHDHLETINSNRKPLEADSSCATCPWLVAILLFVYRICCSFYDRFGRVVFCCDGGLFFVVLFLGFFCLIDGDQQPRSFYGSMQSSINTFDCCWWWVLCLFQVHSVLCSSRPIASPTR